jgi:ubiquinone/menaquinone biosynthesis C-methylase UbiE
MKSSTVAMPTTSVYHDVRFAYDPRRAAVWNAISSYLQPWVSADEGLLDLGAGYGDFTRPIRASAKWALDMDPRLTQHWGPGITPLIQSALEPLPIDDNSLATVFASNFFEHFTQEEGAKILAEAMRVLRPGGRFLAIQPNFRLEPRRYFDDYTHKTIYTDNGFRDFVQSLGWKIVHSEPRFTPFTMKSRFPTWEWLVRLYLASPVRPMAGQFLLIAEKP